MLYTSDKLQRLETVMNEELKLVFKYSITNKLSINLTKANYMVISSSRLNGSIHIHNIERKIETKISRAYIDQNLHWGIDSTQKQKANEKCRHH